MCVLYSFSIFLTSFISFFINAAIFFNGFREIELKFTKQKSFVYCWRPSNNIINVIQDQNAILYYSFFVKWPLDGDFTFQLLILKTVRHCYSIWVCFYLSVRVSACNHRHLVVGPFRPFSPVSSWRITWLPRDAPALTDRNRTFTPWGKMNFSSKKWWTLTNTPSLLSLSALSLVPLTQTPGGIPPLFF